jgi:uncharacterized protein (DUF58 family)
MDFEEVREYQMGDDVRSIDWNVTAKMDRPFIKVFKEERELSILLVLDLSASGVFGSNEQSKRELAAELASVLAFSAARNSDKVGLILYTETVERYIPAGKGRQHILRIIREMLFFEPAGRATQTAEALDFLNRIARRRAVVFLLSDFLHGSPAPGWNRSGPKQDDPLVRALRVTQQRHDLICLRLEDPRERELPNVGLITLEDSETGELIELDTGSKLNRDRYRSLNERRLERFDRALQSAGIDHLTIETGQPYVQALRKLFEKRGHRL